jgi:hypothetical protein
MVSLDWKQIEELKKQGYTETQIQEAVAMYEQEELNNISRTPQTSQGYSPNMTSSFSSPPVDDLARWQLELNDILDRAEHMLRGDIIKHEGRNVNWIENPNPNNNPLNEEGVRLLMKILGNYINRNTILSDYTSKEIKMKVHLFALEINDLLFMKYDEIGMDNDIKRKEYAIIVMMLKDIVHNSYSRAKFGGERESLRKSMTITGNYHGDQQYQYPQQPRKSGWGRSY